MRMHTIVHNCTLEAWAKSVARVLGSEPSHNEYCFQFREFSPLEGKDNLKILDAICIQ